MDHHATCWITKLGMAALLALATTPLAAQEPAKRAEESVRNELEDFMKDLATKAPAHRLKDIVGGIDQVNKSGVVEKALKVGDRAPDFELPNASGKMVKLSALLESGPVVVTWYRGGWCPFCNIVLRGFQKVLPEIKAAGATLTAISPQMPDGTAETVAKDGLDFEVLSDKGNKAAHAFGVAYKLPQVVVENNKGRLDLNKVNGDATNVLPLTATYVIDRRGIIRYAFVDGDFRKSAEPSAVVAALKGLKKTP